MKNNKLFGIILVILSLSIFINIFAFELPYSWFKIIMATVLVLYSFLNITSRNFIKILVPIAFAVVILDFIEPLSNYSFEFIFGTLILSIGLNILIFSTNRNRNLDSTSNTRHYGRPNEYNTTFSETRYAVDSKAFEHASITCRFGESTIDFAQTKLLNDTAQVDITCNFSELTLLIPSRFKIDNQVTTLAGNINIPPSNEQSDATHTLILKGNVIFSELRIFRT